MKEYLKTAFRKKVNIIILLLIACVLAVGLYGLVKPLRQYSFEESAEFTSGVAVENHPVYTGISLPVGVYQVELAYETDKPIGYHCTATDPSVRPGALLTNGENLYAGKGVTGYQMWLLESTDTLQINVTYDGSDSLVTGALTLRETRVLGSVVFSTGLLLLATFWGILLYRAYDVAVGIGSGRKMGIYGVAVITLIASLPYLLGVSMSAGDLVYHLHRIEGVRDGLLSGQFPVRIEPEWVHGHGYASGVFYCNTLLYLPAVLRILGFPITFSYSVFCVVSNLATAWVSYYCFVKIFENRTVGLTCSALYTLSAVRVFKTGMTAAVGESSAMIFLPLILYGFYLVFAQGVEDVQKNKAWLFLGVGYAGLFQTHVLTCEITALLTIVLCVVMVRKVFTRKCFPLLLKGAGAALGMSLWFLVPFLDYYLNEDMHIKHVSARTIQMMGLQPLHLLREWFAQDGYAFHVGAMGWLPVAALLVFVILWIMGAWKKENQDIAFLGKFSTCSCAILMLMSLNIFPWDKIQNLHPVFASLVSSLQFPNRFLGWGTLLGVIAVGCVMRYLKQSHRETAYRMTLLISLVFVITAGVFLTESVMKFRNQFTLYNVEGMGRGYISGAEYLIEGTKGDDLLYREPLVGEGLTLQEYTKGPLEATFTCINKTKSESFVDIPLLLYRGYRAVDKNTGEHLDLTYGENNTVRVQIPGEYMGEVTVSFAPPLYWRISEWITYLVYGAMIVGCFVKRKKDERKEAAQ